MHGMCSRIYNESNTYEIEILIKSILWWKFCVYLSENKKTNVGDAMKNRETDKSKERERERTSAEYEWQ